MLLTIKSTQNHIYSLNQFTQYLQIKLQIFIIINTIIIYIFIFSFNLKSPISTNILQKL